MFTNITDIPLPMAVWLAYDDYDFVKKPNSISATTLLKPVRQIILSARIPEGEQTPVDLSSRISSKLGSAVHSSVEQAWKTNLVENLVNVGYPRKAAEKVVVNPTDLQPGQIPVYIEQRTEKEFMGYTISGKFDFVLDGFLEDIKNTSAYTYVNSTKTDDYILQGSIYKWLEPNKITQDTIRINFVFTDWDKTKTLSNPNYPKAKLMSKTYNLMTIAEIEKWIAAKIHLIEKYKNIAEQDLPYCTDQELWKTDPVYKYYSDPSKTSGRSTKNFESLHEAMLHKAQSGKGIVIDAPGKVKACKYCPAFNFCTQKDQYDLS